MEKINDPHRHFWTRTRINWLSLAVITASILALFLSYSESKERDGSTIREGDFLAFYTAATMVHEGLGKDLSDPQLQLKVESRFLPKVGVGIENFLYPNYVAAFLLPLSNFPLSQARWIMVAVMLIFLGFSVFLGTKYAPILKRNYLVTVAFFISCAPIMVGVIGAHNIALSLFLYSAAIWSLGQKNDKGDFLCGIFLGLWLFKPQYALIIILFFIFSRSWKTLKGAAVIGVIYYLIGTAVSGWLWPIGWIKSQPVFCPTSSINVYPRYLISIPGFLKAIGSLITKREISLHAFAYIPSLIFFFWVASKFWIVGNLPEDLNKRARLEKLLDLAGPAALLISPHPLYYDFGICFFPCAKYMTLKNDRSAAVFIILALLISQATALREQLPVQLLFFGVLGIFFYIYRQPDTKIPARE
jgi:hypothetical protein